MMKLNQPQNINQQKFYLNKAQHYLFMLAPRNLVVIASRRFGKSEGIIMPILLRNVQSMPKSNCGIISETYKQALTRTLPATFHALSRLGYYEDIHYVVGKKAPKNLNFEEPYIKPRNWDNYIHWYNGSVNPIISQDVPYSTNSLTLDTIISDESKTLNHDKLMNETFPALSGLTYYRNNPWHTGYTFVSDMPPPNNWLLKQIDNMDVEMVQLLESLIIELYQLKCRPDVNLENVRYKIRDTEKNINLLRSKITFYAEYSIFENLEYVGKKYVDDQFRNLDANIFKTSILSLRAKNTSGNFYTALSEKHYYTAINNDYLFSFRKSNGSIDWELAKRHKFDCKLDTDIDYGKPLCISFDTNININWLVVGQPDYDNNRLRTLNSFFVKGGKMLPEVVKKFSDYYKPFYNRNVVFYYDHTFFQGRSANSSENFYDTIRKELFKLGWNVSDAYIGKAERHDIKHKNIDMALKGIRGLYPLFNSVNNSALITALEQAGTKISQLGWGKDKSREKDPDSELNPVEHRTDGTDAWDTLWIACNNFPYTNFLSSIKLSTEVF